MTPDRSTPEGRRHFRLLDADVAADVDDELAFHVEQRVAELVASGVPPATAREEALRRIGDLEALKRSCVAIGESAETGRRRREWFGALGMDVRLALRQLRRSPVAALVSVLTLALGIGATTAIFGVVYAVLLRPLPYADADRMTAIAETQQGFPTGVGPGQYAEWVRRNRAFETLSAQTIGTFNLTDGGEPVRVVAAMVSPSLFRTHVMPPAAGRYFLAEEATPGRNKVVVLGHGLFVERFGADRRIVGRTIHLNDEPFTVVGVAPPGFTLRTAGEQLWVPLALTARDAAKFEDHWLTVYGKRRPGVSLADAQRDMERVSREIAALHPDAMVNRSARVRDLRDDLTGDYSRQLTVLLGAVAFILLLACLNVAGLVLARLNARRKEIAVRTALGAGRWRMTRQLLTESMVLAAIGGAAAVIVARLATGVLVGIAPFDVPRLDRASIDGAALAFAVVPTLLCGALLGVLPAMRVTRGDLQLVLREGGRDTTTGDSRDRMRSALVVGEIALALALLAGAALFLRSARNLGRIPLGFDADALVSAHVTLAGARYDSPERLTAGAEQIVERLRSLPHVRAAAVSTSMPLANGFPDVEIHIEGRVYPLGQEPFAYYQNVSTNYFDAMGIRILRGRPFTPADRAGAPPVAIVSEALARRLWPGESPIGKRFYCCSADTAPIWREIVGVAAGVRHYLTRPPLAELYVPLEQAPPASWIWFGNSITLAVRAATPSDLVRLVHAEDVRAAIAAVDPTLPVYDLRTYDDLRRLATAENRFAVLLFSAFAVLAVTLAAIGIYGVLAYMVSQRTREIALRMALGATSFDVVAMVLRQGGRLAACGIILGVVLAAGASRALGTLLYDVTPTDPVAYIAVVVGLGAVALVACWMPARRAAGVEPGVALRE